jgi:diaminopimelate epimerase
MFQQPNELAAFRAGAPAFLDLEQDACATPHARAQRAKSLLPADKARGVRLFFANACRNHFLILLGQSQDVEEAYAHVLRHADSWPFDSVLGVIPLAGGSVRMRVLESDGSESIMCGNGARAVGGLLDLLGWPRRMVLQDGSELPIGVTPDQLYSIPMGHVVRRGDFFASPPSGWPRFHLYSSCGEPHAVVCVPSVLDIPLETWGAATIPHANCTVVARTSQKHVTARTFERGVNRETFSCGTGATAAAQLILDMETAGNIGASGETVVHVRMKGGPLRVRFMPGQGSFLEGPAEVWEVK